MERIATGTRMRAIDAYTIENGIVPGDVLMERAGEGLTRHLLEIIEENGLLYPVKIKMTGNPRASMASANIVLDKIPEKKRGTGAILCLCEEKRWLRDNLIALPVDYL